MGCIGSKDDGNNAHLRKPMPMALFGAGGKERLQGLKEHHIGQMRELGADDPDTLQTAVQLGILLRSQGFHEESQRMLADTYERQVAVLGADHPQTKRTAINLGNMGQVRVEQGDVMKQGVSVARMGSLQGLPSVKTDTAKSRASAASAEYIKPSGNAPHVPTYAVPEGSGGDDSSSSAIVYALPLEDNGTPVGSVNTNVTRKPNPLYVPGPVDAETYMPI